MQQHVGGAQQVRQRLLFDAVNAGLQPLFVFDGFYIVLAHMFDAGGDEATGATGRVEQGFSQLGVEHFDHELGDRAGRVELAGIAGALQVFQDLFVEVAEQVAVLRLVEVDAFVDFVDDLPHQLAGLHVVVGVLENGADDEAALVIQRGGEVLQCGEKLVVDEILQLVAGDALGFRRPVAPAHAGRDGRTVGIVEQFPFCFAVVEDFQEQHPDQLANALRVAINADILAHDVLDGFDGGGDGHGFFRSVWVVET